MITCPAKLPTRYSPPTHAAAMDSLVSRISSLELRVRQAEGGEKAANNAREEAELVAKQGERATDLEPQRVGVALPRPMSACRGCVLRLAAG
jgi:hypothetical protein